MITTTYTEHNSNIKSNKWMENKSFPFMVISEKGNIYLLLSFYNVILIHGKDEELVYKAPCATFWDLNNFLTSPDTYTPFKGHVTLKGVE